MGTLPSKTFLCISSYEKGQPFLREAKRLGSTVILLTNEKVRGGDWPWESLDDVFFMPDLFQKQEVIHGVSHLARSRAFDRIVPLDDYDVEMAASLREHLRLPGMGDTTARHFRDKLAMRVRARDRGILVPDFVHVLNDEAINAFTRDIPAPWMLKPRSEVSSFGIKKIQNSTELWAAINQLGDRRSYFVLERFVPGEVFHVDSLVAEKEVVFSESHLYGRPPFSVMHEGGIFTTSTVERDSQDERELDVLNRRLIRELGLVRGVTHAEFLKSNEDGQFYFIECAARPGGANITDLIEATTGVNLWAEWAKIEIAGEETPYEAPARKNLYGGIVITLAKQAAPDTSAYQDPEIAFRVTRKNHAGLIVTSEDCARVRTLLDSYAQRFQADFHAALPAPDRPPH